MIPVSHRGFWQQASEKNSIDAFDRSFRAGWGVETDVRDRGDQLVISHDRALHAAPTLEEFLRRPRPAGLPLALNIKADGISRGVRLALDELGTADDAFVFDMSIPETRSYLEAGIPVFARMSEVERKPAWIDRCAGVWLDAFEDTWYDADTVTSLLDSGKKVCVVSPELHWRDPRATWELLAAIPHAALLLCTDLPDQATEFFA